MTNYRIIEPIIYHNLRIVITTIIIFSTFSSFAQSFYIPKEHYNYSVKVKVARVIDGDTFVLTDSTHVRMLGVDTPELHKKTKEDSLFADSAAAFTRSLINGKTIKLTFENTAATKYGDQSGLYGYFGRLLAYVWLTDTHGKDSLFVQAELLKAGLARIKYYPQRMRYYYIFRNLKRTARKNALGIWGIDKR